MKITFEGKTFGEVLDQMKELLSTTNSNSLPTKLNPSVAVKAKPAQGPGPDAKPLGELLNDPPVERPVANPVDKPVDPRIAKMRAAKEAKKLEREAAKTAPVAAPPVEEPTPDPFVEADPAEVVKIRQKTIEDLQTAYANGRQKEVFELLSRFGNGAKSFRELPPEAFMPIRQAIDLGALA